MKNFLYVFLNKNQAKKTMLTIFNCQAYKDYKSSFDKYDKINQDALQQAFIDIDYEREESISNGKFYCTTSLPYSIKYKGRKYLKQHYLNKGYKVKFKSSEFLFQKDLIKLSWKRWR